MNLTERLQNVQWLSPEGLHRLAYREWGDPDNPHVLLCVHGLTRSSADFVEVAKRLSDRVRIIAPDMPGRGKSDWLPHGAMYVVPYYVQACVTLIARSNAAKLDWLGTSMGGLIGIGYSCLPKSQTSRLILNDVGPALNLEALRRIGDYVGKSLEFATLEEARTYIRTISAPFGSHSEAQWNHLTDTVLVQKDNGRWTTHYDPAIGDSFQGLTEAAANAHEQALWAAYDAIRAETHVVRGEHSDLLTVETAQTMTQRGPKAKLHTVTGTGHAPTFMSADQLDLIEGILF